MDSNLRRHEPRRLQHRPFGHLDTCPFVWLRVTESNRLSAGYEPAGIPFPQPASIGGSLTCRSPRLSAPPRFEREPGAARDKLPWRKTENTIPTRLRVPRAFQAAPAPWPVSLPYWRTAEVSSLTPLGVPRFQGWLPGRRRAVRVGHRAQSRTAISHLRRVALCPLSYATSFILLGARSSLATYIFAVSCFWIRLSSMTTAPSMAFSRAR